MHTDAAASSTVNKMEKGMPALSEGEVQACLTSWHTTEWSSSVHSYKSPGKHDGVNYIRTNEEVRKPMPANPADLKVPGSYSAPRAPWPSW